MRSNLKMKFLILSLFSFGFVPAAFAESICVQEWIWGGCAVWENVSTLSTGGQPSRPSEFPVYYQNECSRPLLTAIHFLGADNQWKSEGWYTLQPGEKRFIGNLRSRVFYTYAETNENPRTKLKWVGDSNFQLGQNGVLSFAKRVASDNGSVQTFRCNKIEPFHAIVVAKKNGAWASRLANTVAEAEHLALKACNGNQPGSCTVLGRIQPGAFGCLGVAQGTNMSGFGIGPSREKAQAYAKRFCDNSGATDCRIVHVACNN